MLTKSLISVQKPGETCPTVTWTGIQQELQQAQSDVLILLDCCSSGVADGGEGNGVTELLAACPFGIEANGVGHYSFTNALTIELKLLSQKSVFSVGDLYANMYRRNQSYMTQGIANERYPPPIHLRLRSDERFPRSIQLSAQSKSSEDGPAEESGTAQCTEAAAQSSNRKRPISSDSPMPSTKHLHRSKDYEGPGASELSAMDGDVEDCYDSYLNRVRAQEPDEEGEEEAGTVLRSKENPSKNKYPALRHCPKDPPWLKDGNRMLLAVRFAETVPAEELSCDCFADWLRTIPAGVAEVVIEAGFICDSTLLLISLPVSMWTYISDDPAIIPLGRIKSSNLLARTLVSMEKAGAKDGRFAEPPVKIEKSRGKTVSFSEEEPGGVLTSGDFSIIDDTQEAYKRETTGGEKDGLITMLDPHLIRSNVFQDPSQSHETIEQFSTPLPMEWQASTHPISDEWGFPDKQVDVELDAISPSSTLWEESMITSAADPKNSLTMRRRKPYLRPSRQEVSLVRKIGVCISCRLRKAQVNLLTFGRKL